VAEDAAVVVAVEIRLGDLVGDAVPGAVVEQQAAEQRLLGLDRMRRQLERRQLRIAALGE
jgi:predicted aspartyl protease